MKQTLYINLYRSGWYHRQGKPDTTNLHAGDVYTSERLALENAEPDKGYVTTVPFEVDFPGTVLSNPSTSAPVPLSVSRTGQRLPFLAVESLDIETDVPPLEVGDAHYGISYEQWRDNLHAERLVPGLEQPSKAYKPSHGGYPFAHRSGAL
jgi:hypothetical protein